MHITENSTADDPRWAAVVSRDAGADGRFVYAVLTTGIYCRPSCPSRRARPENVSFHDTAADAELAGYRPCRRCRPDQLSPAQERARTITALCRHIDSAEETPGLEELAARAGWSPWHLHRTFKAHTGLTPHAYATARRAQRLQKELPGSETVTQAIHEAGYRSSGRFYSEAEQVLGMTPGRYRAGGAGMHVRFAVGESTLGAILVAQSERGLCAIALGDDPDGLVQDLQDRFPRAELQAGDEAFDELVAQVAGFVEEPQRGLDLPLDIRGTAFQCRVWDVLRKIPPGETLSYQEGAERIGSPGASRAVAGACARNPLAVAIPCHRVVRQDGGISGYRWGVERKRALLARERNTCTENTRVE